MLALAAVALELEFVGGEPPAVIVVSARGPHRGPVRVAVAGVAPVTVPHVRRGPVRAAVVGVPAVTAREGRRGPGRLVIAGKAVQ